MPTVATTLIDSHAHIYGAEFSEDFGAMLDRAAEVGVASIIVPGADLPSSRAAVALARQYPHLHAAVGIHPHDAASATTACIEAIRALAVPGNGVVAIGEVGLDFYRDRAPRPVQEEVFRRFIALARELSLPLIIHDRDAHDRVLQLLREEEAREAGGVLHCFSGDVAMARNCIDMGFLISIPGTVTYPSNTALHEVVRQVRVESMLIETDAPYLSPVPFRGRRNEPAHVRLTAEKVAQLKGLSLEDVARITSLNTRRLFRLPEEEATSPIAYAIRNSLYLNITNRCTNRCSFCPKFQDFTVKGHNLRLHHEPTAGEVLAAIGDARAYDEVVFCGYGEPLLRPELIREVAACLKGQGVAVRVNTDGLANLVHGRNILPELAGLVDVISVSLNAADAASYAELCRSPHGEDAFPAVCAFLREATRHIPTVIATAVALPGLDTTPIRALAQSLGVIYRERPFADVG
jgi:TatD DNase family protein